MDQNLLKVIEFSLELEKLKNVLRRTKPIGLDRFENSAEHSWQIALVALSLVPHAKQAVDTAKVVSMLLLHDVVEIDTGDKFAYDANHDDYENELAAAKRIFGLLPTETCDKFLNLWIEFEQAETADARFAKAVDRLLPVIQNISNKGQSWINHKVTVDQVLHKNAGIADLNDDLWSWVKEEVEKTFSEHV
ncbi:HD domain-containing protein [Alteromonadaceae bacterium M269]|nr:HD domain-containing protein [Alteromonadaceae bacterium M269]